MILGSRSLTLDAAGTEEIHTEMVLFVGTFDFRVPTFFPAHLHKWSTTHARQVSWGIHPLNLIQNGGITTSAVDVRAKLYKS